MAEKDEFEMNIGFEEYLKEREGCGVKLDAEKLKNLGSAFYKKKQFDRAIENYDKVL